MRTFAISDIHGCSALFDQALKKMELSKDDRLIILGDLINKGPDSKGVLDRVLELQRGGFQVQCLLGNHEKMFLDAVLSVYNQRVWLTNGGEQTLASFGVTAVEMIPPEYISMIGGFRYFIETPDYVLVHAALNMNLPDPFKDKTTMLWEKDSAKYLNQEWLGSRKLIHGHKPRTRQEIAAMVENKSGIICIDNGSFMDKEGYGGLSILQLETLDVSFVH